MQSKKLLERKAYVRRTIHEHQHEQWCYAGGGGHITVGCSREGVVINLPPGGRTGSIVFSPAETAMLIRTLGKKMNEHAVLSVTGAFDEGSTGSQAESR